MSDLMFGVGLGIALVIGIALLLDHAESRQRERCAKLCEKQGCAECAAAIRAMGDE